MAKGRLLRKGTVITDICGIQYMEARRPRTAARAGPEKRGFRERRGTAPSVVTSASTGSSGHGTVSVSKEQVNLFLNKKSISSCFLSTPKEACHDSLCYPLSCGNRSEASLFASFTVVVDPREINHESELGATKEPEKMENNLEVNGGQERLITADITKRLDKLLAWLFWSSQCALLIFSTGKADYLLLVRLFAWLEDGAKAAPDYSFVLDQGQ
ncbi:hypothetical protein V8F06_008647 [Rhypophila decipiens]